jgi:V/A-type H+-transporting ATPase subunit C
MSVRAISTYAELQARVRALYSRLLSPKIFYTLLQAKDFETVIANLKKTDYGPYLDAVDQDALSPRRATYQFYRRLADAYGKLIDLTPGPGRDVLLQLWRLFEIDNLKATLRGIEHKVSWDQVLYLLAPRERHFLVSFDDMHAMLRRGNIDDALDVIRDTPYYDPLDHALSRYHEEKTLFPLEVALDLDYRRGLWESIQTLRGRDRKEALRLVGTVIDVDNLLWAIRYRVYHHLSEQEIINYTVPFGYQTEDVHIRAIARGEDIVTAIKGIYPEIEVVGDFETDPGQALAHLEQLLNRRIVQMCRVTFRGDPFHIGLPVAYLLLLEHEVEDLTAVVEAKASGLGTEMLYSVIDIVPLDAATG